MVDFNKLRAKPKNLHVTDPIEIFRRLPKPMGFNDLYTSQANVLNAWYGDRNKRDTVIKLHTGGGKTLVGLLIAQSTLAETGEPVLYLTPTKQLVNQTVEKALAHGISAVPYEAGQPLNPNFLNGKSVLVGAYKAFFHGKSLFGVRGVKAPQNLSAIILDDAHAAFSVVRESFTLNVEASDNRERYENLCGIFGYAFDSICQSGTFSDIVDGREQTVLEVPYWAWKERIDAIQEQLKNDGEKYWSVWPLLRDNLKYCHALISKDSFTISPVLPLINMFPSFVDAPRKIYMSATIADDTEIVRTFNADISSVNAPLESRSLAGVSERMILLPELMAVPFEPKDDVAKIVKWVAANKRGAVIIVPSDKAALEWTSVATFAQGPTEVDKMVSSLQKRSTFGPVVFSNRYDGIDLPNDSCRLLVLCGLPASTSVYERYRASVLYGSATVTRMLAQRIEQGIGRGARGSGDHCVVLLIGRDLTAWIAKDANFRFLTSATRAQLEMGVEISKQVQDITDLIETMKLSLKREPEWTEYHAATLADYVDEEHSDSIRIEAAGVERKSFGLWLDGYAEKAIHKIRKALSGSSGLDRQAQGWLKQFAARIADDFGNRELTDELQRDAYSDNKNLLRPKTLPPYRLLPLPSSQAQTIVSKISGYKNRLGYLQYFDDTVARLRDTASANQFEQALVELSHILGFSAERKDVQGEGPDVLILMPNRVGLVVEAKSRKLSKNPLTKDEHGQLLVAEKWFARMYPDYSCIRVSVHKTNKSTVAASATSSFALTLEKLSLLVSDARILIDNLCRSQLATDSLELECEQLLATSPLSAKDELKNYLVPFEEE